MTILIYAICGLYTVLNALFNFRETALLQTLSILGLLFLVIAAVLSLIHIIRRWSSLRLRALIPIAACVVAFGGASHLGRIPRDIYLRSQIPRLSRVVEAFAKTGTLPETQWAGYQTTAAKLEDQGIVATFWWGGGFPVKHTALVYCSHDDLKSCMRRPQLQWYYGYSLERHWWIVKD